MNPLGVLSVLVAASLAGCATTPVQTRIVTVDRPGEAPETGVPPQGVILRMEGGEAALQDAFGTAQQSAPQPLPERTYGSAPQTRYYSYRVYPVVPFLYYRGSRFGFFYGYPFRHYPRHRFHRRFRR